MESEFTASKFRKLPVVIEAMQWDGSRESIVEICKWANEGLEEPVISYLFNGAEDAFDVQVWTLEGPLNISERDYIIKGVNGEFYPCKPDIFEKAYELIGDLPTVPDPRLIKEIGRI